MAGFEKTINVQINTEGIADRFEELSNDRTLKLAIHMLLAKKCDPYVPYLNNPLSTTVEITSDHVRYVQPYARYQYFGVDFNHTLTHHPLASAFWDEAMLRDHREEFEAEIKEYMVRRYKELYG